MSNKKPIKISEVLNLLNEGKKRPEVAEALGITMAECRKLFEHPKLKGKQARKPVGFVVVDDLEEEENEEVKVETTSDVENVSVDAEEVSSDTQEEELPQDSEETQENLSAEKPSWS